MAVPKRRTSKAKKHSRKANWKLSSPGTGECPQCHNTKLNHRVCKSCGYYANKAVVEIKEDKE